MIILIDFDGSSVTHEYPQIGKDIGAAPVLRELVEVGHQLILWTMRSHVHTIKKHGETITVLQDAVNWFKENNISLFGINENPEQPRWTNSPKPLADLCIDDTNAGCPLMYDLSISKSPFVNWAEMRRELVERGFLK